MVYGKSHGSIKMDYFELSKLGFSKPSPSPGSHGSHGSHGSQDQNISAEILGASELTCLAGGELQGDPWGIHVDQRLPCCGQRSYDPPVFSRSYGVFATWSCKLNWPLTIQCLKPMRVLDSYVQLLLHQGNLNKWKSIGIPDWKMIYTVAGFLFSQLLC